MILDFCFLGCLKCTLSASFLYVLYSGWKSSILEVDGSTNVKANRDEAIWSLCLFWVAFTWFWSCNSTMHQLLFVPSWKIRSYDFQQCSFGGVLCPQTSLTKMWSFAEQPGVLQVVPSQTVQLHTGRVWNATLVTSSPTSLHHVFRLLIYACFYGVFNLKSILLVPCMGKSIPNVNVLLKMS